LAGDAPNIGPIGPNSELYYRALPNEGFVRFDKEI
jgi:hypothetical protein